MKILHIEDFFHPDAGYQINLLAKYMAQDGHEVIIITSEIEKTPEYLKKFFGEKDIRARDSAYTKRTRVKIIRFPIYGFVSNRAVFHHSIYKCIKKINPDLLFQHGNDTLMGMRIILKSKKLGVPYITDSHMVDMASQNRFRNLYYWWYKRFITPKIITDEIPVIRTMDTDYVEKRLGIPLTQTELIEYGSDTLIFHPDKNVKAQFRKENGIPQDAFVVLYAGRIDEKKGGMFFAQTILRKIETEKKLYFVIIGNTVGEQGREIERTFDQSDNRILRFETQQYENLRKFYQMADCAVYPKQCSLSYYDVQACGLPVIFEDNEINVKRAKGNAITFMEDNQEDFRSAIQYIVNINKYEYEQMSQKAIKAIEEEWSFEIQYKKYMKLIETQIKKKRQILK